MKLAVGDVVVLRGLTADPRSPSSALPPKVGKIVRLLAAGEFLVRMRVGGMGSRIARWCPKSRLCRLANIARAATPREITVGFPIDPLPAVAS